MLMQSKLCWFGPPIDAGQKTLSGVRDGTGKKAHGLLNSCCRRVCESAAWSTEDLVDLSIGC